MPHGHCQACLGYFSLSEFQVLPCGHGGCKYCLGRIFDSVTNMGNCWMCRQEFHRSGAHRIHLELVDSKVANFQNTIEGLEKMDASVPSISVSRASTRIKRTVDEINCDNEIAISLRQAIADFDDRIVPVFIRVEAQAKEVEQLQKQLACTQSKVKAFDESSEKKDALIIALRSDLDRSNKDSRQAVSNTERLTADYLASKRQNELDTEVKNKLEHDNRNLRGLLEWHTKSAQSRKDKIQALKHEIAKLEQRNETLQETQSAVLDQTLSVFPLEDHADETFLSSSSSARPTSPSEHFRNKFYRPSRLSQITNELPESEVDMNFDSGMPGPGFSSDWKMSSTTKRKAASLNFPIPLDKRGHPTVSVQTGPVRLRRVP